MKSAHEVIQYRLIAFTVSGLLAFVSVLPQVSAQLENTATGVGALVSVTDGDYNTADGYNALNQDTIGSSNTAVGRHALYGNTTGNLNSALGVNALYHNTTGDFNTAIGYQALFTNTTGSFSLANGVSALFSNTTGTLNTANGYAALYLNTTGSQNTANGFSALFHNTTGYNNVANGYQALFSSTIGIDNTASGAYALNFNANGHYNTADGFNALYRNTSGAQNVAIGVNALVNNTIGGSVRNNGVISDDVLEGGFECRARSADRRIVVVGRRIELGEGGLREGEQTNNGQKPPWHGVAAAEAGSSGQWPALPYDVAMHLIDDPKLNWFTRHGWPRLTPSPRPNFTFVIRGQRAILQALSSNRIEIERRNSNRLPASYLSAMHERERLSSNARSFLQQVFLEASEIMTTMKLRPLAGRRPRSSQRSWHCCQPLNLHFPYN